MSEEAKANIEKMKAAIEQLKTSGEDLFKDEIAALQVKIDEAEKAAAAEVEKVVEAVNQTEQTFIQKYGANVAKGVELVLLGLIAGRILGVI